MDNYNNTNQDSNIVYRNLSVDAIEAELRARLPLLERDLESIEEGKKVRWDVLRLRFDI